MARLKKRDHSMTELDSGSQLPWKAHRLRGKVTLETISEVTKLSRRFLEAIESGTYGELPGGVFTTSYIRQYAAMIDFDCDVILEHQGGGAKGKEPGRPVEGTSWGKGLVTGAWEKG